MNKCKYNDHLFWGLGIGDWGLPNPQSPIPNPHLLTNLKSYFISLYYYLL